MKDIVISAAQRRTLVSQVSVLCDRIPLARCLILSTGEVAGYRIYVAKGVRFLLSLIQNAKFPTKMCQIPGCSPHKSLTL